MPVMFRKFLLEHPLDTVCFMWWDLLRHFQDDRDPDIVAAMIRSLDEVLQLPARHCWMSALHGLGHLAQEANEEIIRKFLSTHQDIDEDVLKYAELAITGAVL